MEEIAPVSQLPEQHLVNLLGVQYPAPISQAINAVMMQVDRLARDGRNEDEGYGYASIDAFLGMTGPLCAKAGLIVKPIVVSTRWDTIEMYDDKSGQMKPRRVIHFEFKFRLIHAATGTTFTDPEDIRPLTLEFGGPQTMMSAESYALKGYFRPLLQIATGDADVDQKPKMNSLVVDTKSEAKAAKRKRETGINYVPIDFTGQHEDVPLESAERRIVDHIREIGNPAEARKWWEGQTIARESLQSFAPKTLLTIKRAVERELDNIAKTRLTVEDEVPFHDAAE